MCSSRGREIREAEEGPYMRKRTVRVPLIEGNETKKTALVKAPETFRTTKSRGRMLVALKYGICKSRKISKVSEVNSDVLYFLQHNKAVSPGSDDRRAQIMPSSFLNHWC